MNDPLARAGSLAASITGIAAPASLVKAQSTQKSGGTIPPAGASGVPGAAGSLPTLPAPAGPMSLENLMSALGHEVRRQACKDGITSIEVRAEEEAEANKKQLDELGKQIEKMAKQKVLNGFLKAFKIIGLIVGAIAAVATFAAGVVTGNPLLMVGGAIAFGMALDSTLSLATDGKVCMMAGFQKLGEAMGMSKENAEIFALCMQIVVMIAAVAVSLGAAFSSAGSAAKVTTEAAEKAMQITMTAQRFTNFMSAGLTVADGGMTIAGAVIAYDVAKSQANVKELEAILQRIRDAIEMEQESVENEMERAAALMDAVSDLVDGCNQTQTTILTAAPSMA